MKGSEMSATVSMNSVTTAPKAQRIDESSPCVYSVRESVALIEGNPEILSRGTAFFGNQTRSIEWSDTLHCDVIKLLVRIGGQTKVAIFRAYR
jgi:hypothetical protein